MSKIATKPYLNIHPSDILETMVIKTVHEDVVLLNCKTPVPASHHTPTTPPSDRLTTTPKTTCTSSLVLRMELIVALSSSLPVRCVFSLGYLSLNLFLAFCGSWDLSKVNCWYHLAGLRVARSLRARGGSSARKSFFFYSRMVDLGPKSRNFESRFELREASQDYQHIRFKAYSRKRTKAWKATQPWTCRVKSSQDESPLLKRCTPSFLPSFLPHAKNIQTQNTHAKHTRNRRETHNPDPLHARAKVQHPL